MVMNSGKLTIGIIAKNEERLLPLCLKSICPIADEIIVVDTGSTDRTVEVARKFGAKILFYPWNNNFAKARNIYVKSATNPWILSIDADETIAYCDLPKIEKVIKNNSASAYFLKQRVYTSLVGTGMDWYPLDGRYPQEERRSKTGGFLETQFIRLFRRTKEILFDEKIQGHENIKDAILKSGGMIKDTNITVHDYGCLKGNVYTWRKQKKYFRMDLNELSRRRLKEFQLRNLALGYLNQKAPDKALHLLHRILKRNKEECIRAHYLSAVAYREKSLLEKSIFHLRKVFKINKRFSSAFWLMGVCLDELGSSEEGLGYVSKALKEVPNHALYLNSAGVIYYRLNKLQEARKAFRKAITNLPSYRQASLNLSRLNYELASKN